MAEAAAPIRSPVGGCLGLAMYPGRLRSFLCPDNYGESFNIVISIVSSMPVERTLLAMCLLDQLFA